MRILLVVIVLLVAGVVCLGFYRGWFSFTSEETEGKSNITLTVNQDKLKKDKEAATNKVFGAGSKGKDEAAGPAGKISDGTMVSLKGSELTIADKDGKEHRHTLAADVKVTCDGKVCTAADLRARMKVRVTANNNAPNAVNRIEALDQIAEFENSR